MAFYYFSNLCCQVSLMKWRRDKADLFLYRVPSLSFRGPGLLPLRLTMENRLGCWGLDRESFPNLQVLVSWREHQTKG